MGFLAYMARNSTVDFALTVRVAERYAKRKLVKVKNRETGKVVYKDPEVFRKKRELYEKLPVEYDRRPKGRPRKTPEPSKTYLPAPPKVPKPKKAPKPKKPVKPPTPAPPPKVPEAPKPAPRDPPMTQKWKK